MKTIAKLSLGALMLAGAAAATATPASAQVSFGFGIGPSYGYYGRSYYGRPYYRSYRCDPYGRRYDSYYCDRYRYYPRYGYSYGPSLSFSFSDRNYRGGYRRR